MPALPPLAPATATAPIDTDAVVIGAGPVGLFQVFELGLLEIGAHVVDALPQAGGQCIALYADKPIYDIPAIMVCSGRELVERLLAQIAPFAPSFHLGQQVNRVDTRPDGRFDLTTSAGTRFITRTVIVAGGVGSFQPRRLKLDGLDRFEGSQLFYATPAPAHIAGRHVVVIGDADAALEFALGAAGHGHGDGAGVRADGVVGARAASVRLMHRRDVFKAAPATLDALRAAQHAGRLSVVAAQAAGIEQSDGRLTGLVVDHADGSTATLALDTLVVLTGLSPKLGPIADWGLALERKQLVVNTETFETSTPGIFAIGDVVTYPGKKKLILSGFHEAALAAHAASARLHPTRSTHLEYTTSSPRLQRLLGVAPDAQPPAETP